MNRSSEKDKAERRGRRTFSAAFRAEAVDLMRRRRVQGASLAQIGRELDVRPQLLWEWARKQDGRGTGRVDGPPGVARAAAVDESLEDEVRRLRREVALLRQERDFAKKAAAFFAKESL